MLCAERFLGYLVSESAYKRNADNHLFGQWMTKDTDFLKAVGDTFETNMRPCKGDLFKTKIRLNEVKEGDFSLELDVDEFAKAVHCIPAEEVKQILQY